jgi:hypothetical protein
LRLSIPFIEYDGAALFEVMEQFPGRLQSVGSRKARVQHRRGAQFFEFFETRRWARTIIGRNHRRRNSPAGFFDLFALGQRIDPDRIYTRFFHVRDGTLDGIFEVAALRSDGIAARTYHEIRVQLFFSCHCGFEFSDRLLARNQAPSGKRPRFFRRLLIFDMQSGRARSDIGLNRMIHVHRVAVARISIGKDRDITSSGKTTHRVRHFTQTEQTYVGISINIGADL